MIGDYSLTAKAIDNDDAATISSPVNIAVSAISGDVAIVRNFDDPEIGTLQDYLFEMGLSSSVFAQEGLTFETLQRFKLVLWDDLGDRAQGLTDREVAIFDRVFTNGIPLYFIGENLAAAAANLSEPSRAKWMELIHLGPANGKGGSGTISLAETPGNNSILQGRFGSAQDFAYPPVLDLATSTGDTAEVLGQSGAADVLVAHPHTDEADLGEVRTFTQNVRVVSGVDSASLGERKTLFQNVVCWLLRCGGCGAINLALELSGSAESVTAGSELIYSLAVHHSGECEGTGVVVTNRLPPGVRFVTAEKHSRNLGLCGWCGDFSPWPCDQRIDY